MKRINDEDRMNWLVSMGVEVRTPLIRGSRELFTAQTVSDMEDDIHQTSLREQIDAEIQPDRKLIDVLWNFIEEDGLPVPQPGFNIYEVAFIAVSHPYTWFAEYCGGGRWLMHQSDGNYYLEGVYAWREKTPTPEPRS